MDCCRSSRDAGYATPAALVICLAFGLVAATMVSRSVQALRLSKRDFERVSVEYALSGAQHAAAAAVVNSQAPGPYHWAWASEVGWIDALAEPEDQKLSLTAASQLSDEVLRRFEVSDTEALRTALAAAAQADRFADVGALDGSPLWRACAGRLMSRYGRKQNFRFRPSIEPGLQTVEPLWRIGEAWRIRVTTTAGWRDDRIVRFTGDARRPAAVLARGLSRGENQGERCDAILQAIAVA